MSHNWGLLGRFLYGIPLSVTGIIYLTNPQGAVETLTSFIPGGLSLIYIAGALWVILGLAIALNFWPRWATWGVIALLGAFLVMVHIPAVYAGEYLTIAWFELLRDVSLMGGAFLLSATEGQDRREARTST